MAKLTSPSSLNVATEIVIDEPNRTIRLVAAGNLVAKDGVTYGECTETAVISVGVTARASVSAYAAYVPEATVTGATETNVAATVPWASVTLAVTLDARSVWLW